MSKQFLERRGLPPRRGLPAYYDSYADRRQPHGIVATYVRGHGELIRSRVDYIQLSLIIRARLDAQNALPFPDQTGEARLAGPTPSVGPVTELLHIVEAEPALSQARRISKFSSIVSTGLRSLQSILPRRSYAIRS